MTEDNGDGLQTSFALAERDQSSLRTMSGVEHLDGARCAGPASVGKLGGSGQGLTHLGGQQIRVGRVRTARVGARARTGRVLQAGDDLVHSAGGRDNALSADLLIG